MSAPLERLAKRVRRTSLAQAARLVERLARRSTGPRRAPVGGDARPGEEALRLRASERMTSVAGDLAASVVLPDGQVELQANVLGLAGASAALPPQYSEFLLQRRRLRDRGMADFLNIFDHRALSFFYRIHAKHDRAMAFESQPAKANSADTVTALLQALGGLGNAAARPRIAGGSEWLGPLAGEIGGIRRSAATLRAVIARLTSRPVRIVEATPRWLPLPTSEQTRLGDVLNGKHHQLGGGASAGSAVVGGAMLDIQHHYTVELGPLPHDELLGYCREPDRTREIGELCMLVTGSAHRARLRLLVEAQSVPPLRLGDLQTPALLGLTSWMPGGSSDAQFLTNCEMDLGRL